MTDKIKSSMQKADGALDSLTVSGLVWAVNKLPIPKKYKTLIGVLLATLSGAAFGIFEAFDLFADTHVDEIILATCAAAGAALGNIGVMHKALKADPPVPSMTPVKEN